MKVLVTGASGFVGSWLVPKLVELGHETIACVFPEGSEFPDHASRVEDLGHISQVIELDLTNAGSVAAALETRPDAVVHLAAVSSGAEARKDIGKTWEVNAAGTARLAETLSSYTGSSKPKLLLASTGEVYGVPSGEERFVETSPTRPISPYAASKLGAEIAALEVARRTGLRVVVARSFGHTGAGQDTRFVIPAFAKRIADGKVLNAVAVPVGNLETVRDFTSVHDVVNAYCLLLEHGNAGEVYNIASGKGSSLRDVFFAIADALETRVIPEVDAAFTRAGDIPYLVGDATKLRRLTGWEPTVTLDAIIKEVVDAGS